jgi:tetratricopeptide (TPR) repeat protein
MVSQRTLSAEYFVREIKTHRALALFLLVLALGSAIGLIYFFRNRTTFNLPAKSATLISAAANPTSNRGTTNEEAYRSYLQGKNLSNQRRTDADIKAIEYFEQAIHLDPGYARAYAGLAHAYFGLAGMGGGSPRIENEKAKQAVQKALELDSNLGEAYAVRGIIDLAYDYDFAAAEKDSTLALELEPNNDTVLWGHANLCLYLGRFEQALKEMEAAQTIMPGTYRYERDRGRILYYARRYDEAIVQLERNAELKQEAGKIWLSRAQEMKGNYAAAFEAFLNTQKDQQRIEAFQTAYQTTGWRGVKRKFIEFSILDEQNSKRVNNYQIAIAFAQLGEKDQAFAYLDKLAEERSWQIPMLSVDPQVDPLRDDPRFEKLLKLVRR